MPPPISGASLAKQQRARAETWVAGQAAVQARQRQLATANRRLDELIVVRQQQIAAEIAAHKPLASYQVGSQQDPVIQGILQGPPRLDPVLQDSLQGPPRAPRPAKPQRQQVLSQKRPLSPVKQPKAKSSKRVKHVLVQSTSVSAPIDPVHLAPSTSASMVEEAPAASSGRPLVETYSFGEDAYRIDCNVYSRRAEPAVATATVESHADGVGSRTQLVGLLNRLVSAQAQIPHELALDCSSLLAQLEPAQAAVASAPVIDYDTSSLEHLRAQFSGICKVMCLQMYEDGIWPVVETPEKVSFMPSTGKDDEEEKGPGLPFPRRLGDHLTELWSRSTLKPPTALKTCLTWPEHFKMFCQLSSAPSVKELGLFNVTEAGFRRKLIEHGVKDSTEESKRVLNCALGTIRLEASSQAMAQADYALLVKNHKGMSELMDAQDPESSGYKKLEYLRDNLVGLQLSVWAKHTLAFAAADAAARSAHGAIRALREDACKCLLGKDSPKEVVDRLIGLPIQNGTLFGPQLEQHFSKMAKTQAVHELVSRALESVGSKPLPATKGKGSKKPFQGKPRASGHTKGRFAAAQSDFVSKAKRKGKSSAKKPYVRDTKSSTPKKGKDKKERRSGHGKSQGKSKGKPKGK
jgi:hypothetical protein